MSFRIEGPLLRTCLFPFVVRDIRDRNLIGRSQLLKGNMMDDIDEVALNTMMADGIDPATAYVASIREPEPQRATTSAVRIVQFSVLVGVVIVLLAILLK